MENKLAIHLIGSGHLGIANITYYESAKSIIDTFIVFIQNTNKKITNHLKIVIHYKDLNKIDIEKLNEYIKYRCMFYKSGKEYEINGDVVDS